MASLVGGDETDSDDEEPFLDNNKQKAKLKGDVDKLRKKPKVGRRLRQRSLGQQLTVQVVPENGHCLYIAILQATRDKGLLPGSKFQERSEMLNVFNLRQEMITYLNAGKGEVVRNLIATNMFGTVLERIRGGITDNNESLRPTVDSTLWGGDPEICIMKKLYDLDLVLLEKHNAINGVIGNNIITASTAILVYSGIHYEWAKVRNWTTFMQQTPAQVQIKF
tara:strand:+ start:799 stop:1464 length:666 start_codon:yes stop_codon:yes gene_type:complete